MVGELLDQARRRKRNKTSCALHFAKRERYLENRLEDSINEINSTTQSQTPTQLRLFGRGNPPKAKTPRPPPYLNRGGYGRPPGPVSCAGEHGIAMRQLCKVSNDRERLTEESAALKKQVRDLEERIEDLSQN